MIPARSFRSKASTGHVKKKDFASIVAWVIFCIGLNASKVLYLVGNRFEELIGEQ